MLTLCGFAASNYYCKVKLALLEKGVTFNEELAWLGETDPAASPLGKVPYLKTEHGPLSESTVILEYLEDAYPAVPRLAQAMPHAQRVDIEGGMVPLPEQMPQQFADVVGGFLVGLPD